ncbi:hypothetical protein BGV72_00925 [Burkholderia ubonensis]|nr:hypothetical protein BGV72_00925 [Burkholderia ubonensis]
MSGTASIPLMPYAAEHRARPREIASGTGSGDGQRAARTIADAPVAQDHSRPPPAAGPASRLSRAM